MPVKNYLAGAGDFVRGFARALDLGSTPASVAAGWPEPLTDDASALLADWEALAGDQRRAWQRLTAELGGSFNAKGP